jgi:hypothetical protein
VNKFADIAVIFIKRSKITTPKEFGILVDENIRI